MSNFEQRVNAAAALEMNDRFKALAKLDLEIAKRYVVGVNPVNAENLKNKRPLEGFGGFAEHDVDSVLAAALGPSGKGKISKEAEEALVIILLAKTPWKGRAKEYMIAKLEENLKFEWSSKSIAGEAPQLLQFTKGLDFISPGTGFHFSPTEFQIIAGLIAQNKIGAWEASGRRTFLQIPEGQVGAWGFYDPNLNDIYIVSGLTADDRQCTFVHLATLAIRDFRNLPEAKAKHIAADGYIAQAFVALSQKDPYSTYPDRPEEVAYAQAAQLLQKSVRDRSRDKTWKPNFQKAYAKVVDAVVNLKGTKTADEIVDMLEDQQGQDAETALVKKVLKGLKKP